MRRIRYAPPSIFSSRCSRISSERSSYTRRRENSCFSQVIIHLIGLMQCQRTYRSFVSQRNHRIDAGGTAGWHETSDQTDRNEHAGCHGKGEWIVWSEIKEQRTRASGGGESKDNADADAKNEQHQSLPDDDADNISTARS